MDDWMPQQSDTTGCFRWNVKVLRTTYDCWLLKNFSSAHWDIGVDIFLLPNMGRLCSAGTCTYKDINGTCTYRVPRAPHPKSPPREPHWAAGINHHCHHHHLSSASIWNLSSSRWKYTIPVQPLNTDLVVAHEPIFSGIRALETKVSGNILHPLSLQKPKLLPRNRLWSSSSWI